MYELVAIEKALEKSYPACKSEDKSIDFIFLSDDWKGYEQADATHVEHFFNGKPAIVITRKSIAHDPTESLALEHVRQNRDARGSKNQGKDPWQLIRASLEFSIRHELAHNSQLRIGWFSPGYRHNTYYEKLGWIAAKSKDLDPLLKVPDGRVYRSVDGFHWQPVLLAGKGRTVGPNVHHNATSSEAVSSETLRSSNKL